MTAEFDTYYDAIDLARDSVARAFTMMVHDRSDVSVAAYETALDAQKSARDGLGRAIREKDAREFKAAGLPCTA